ncbi:hypothetical protein THOM_2134 [Trachipleistophora hominis]|uniref:Uncharacterized protein n=1 Tax=Trachipleistophora hominis TaxID=72359 RepID=L7JUF7_TRAHO|nr:hypothetical protein THOM_2134 [Trachipleistophora hominis]
MQCALLFYVTNSTVAWKELFEMDRNERSTGRKGVSPFGALFFEKKIILQWPLGSLQKELIRKRRRNPKKSGFMQRHHRDDPHPRDSQKASQSPRGDSHSGLHPRNRGSYSSPQTGNTPCPNYNKSILVHYLSGRSGLPGLCNIK